MKTYAIKLVTTSLILLIWSLPFHFTFVMTESFITNIYLHDNGMLNSYMMMILVIIPSMSAYYIFTRQMKCRILLSFFYATLFPILISASFFIAWHCVGPLPKNMGNSLMGLPKGIFDIFLFAFIPCGLLWLTRLGEDSPEAIQR